MSDIRQVEREAAKDAEIELLRFKLAWAANFLDVVARHLGRYRMEDDTAAECREMARQLRSET